MPKEMKAIDEAGAKSPPVPSLTPSWLPCARVARIRVVLGVYLLPCSQAYAALVNGPFCYGDDAGIYFFNGFIVVPPTLLVSSRTHNIYFFKCLALKAVNERNNSSRA
jgi:hypothetical protein